MASTPFPILLHDHTRAGIRWRVSIHPELSADGAAVVRFLKRGKQSKLLDQHCRWSPQGGWARGHAPSSRVPQALRLRTACRIHSGGTRQPTALSASAPWPEQAAAPQLSASRQASPWCSGLPDAVRCARGLAVAGAEGRRSSPHTDGSHQPLPPSSGPGLQARHAARAHQKKSQVAAALRRGGTDPQGWTNRR